MLKLLLRFRRVAILGAIAAIVLIVAGLVTVQHLQAAGPVERTVPISTLLDAADAHQIVWAHLSDRVVLAADRAGHLLRANREPTAPITVQLRSDGVVVTVLPSAPSGGAAQSLPIMLFVGCILLVSVLMLRRGGTSNQLLSFGRSRARVAGVNKSLVTFDDVAGAPEAKVELSEIVQFLKQPEKFFALGARIPKGVLLIGPPGTGKTLMARAVAGEADVNFFSISGAEFVEMFVGVGASRVRDLFREARKAAPCIIFIDEIDAVGRRRGGHASGGNEEREQTLNQLLVEMDGFDARTNIIVIGATNRPDILDGALLRPGRFDRQVTMDAPDVQGRSAILDLHVRAKPLGSDVNLGVLARETVGFTGADLSNLVNEAAILAARGDCSTIGMQHLEESILRVVAGPERRSRVISAEEKAIIAYHEVGHAVVMRSLKHADPVRKVSIIARGQALGVTISAPKDDQRLMTSGQLKAKMAGAMGGRVAEAMIFGDVTTGARQDIDHATMIARRMVYEFGMSDLGMIRIPDGDNPSSTPVSEEVRGRADQEIAKLTQEAYATADQILCARRAHLVTIAEHLMLVETIDGDELDTLLAQPALLSTALEPTGESGEALSLAPPR